jgi:molecular chaperone GrpE
MPTPDPFASRKVYRLRRRKHALKSGAFSASLPEPPAASRRAAPAAEAPKPAGPSPAELELEAIRPELEALKAQFQDAQDRILRAHADLDNQRRRHQKEKEDLRKFATEGLMEELAPAMDHFELAMRSLDTASDVASVRQGVQMIHRELLAILQSNGLEAISAKGEKFDPALHEAVATAAEETAGDNEILDVLRPGWLLRGRVIRPAMVRVNKLHPPTPAVEG